MDHGWTSSSRTPTFLEADPSSKAEKHEDSDGNNNGGPTSKSDQTRLHRAKHPVEPVPSDRPVKRRRTKR